jgi:DNA-directed RNA polymerase omega subunit
MRKPTIDELLEKCDSIYELTMLAAKEATRIRLNDRDATEPLQKALERIASGQVKGKYLSGREMDEYESKQRERREAAAAMRERTIIPLPPREIHVEPEREE